jgi:hypothetical protein
VDDAGGAYSPVGTARTTLRRVFFPFSLLAAVPLSRQILDIFSGPIPRIVPPIFGTN